MTPRTFDQRRAARMKRTLDNTAGYLEIEQWMATIQAARDNLTNALRAMLDGVVRAMEDGSLPVALLIYDIGQCHCLCGVHNRTTGGICEATADYALTLVGGVVDPSTDRQMCRPCAQWWCEYRPERVGAICFHDKSQSPNIDDPQFLKLREAELLATSTDELIAGKARETVARLRVEMADVS